MEQINPVVYLIAFLVFLAFYLRGQARIKTLDSSFFNVDWNEKIKVIRKKRDDLVIQWQESLKPIRILFSQPDNENEVQKEFPLSEPQKEFKISGLSMLPRPFIEIFFDDNSKKIVAERILPMQNIRNFRDIGGYETMQGDQVAWGKIFRSGDLGSPTSGDQEYIRQLGIRSVLDLRDEYEIKKRPDEIQFGANYQHIHVAHRVMVTRLAVLFRRQNLLKQFVNSYKTAILDQGAESIGRIVEILSHPENLPALLHCTAGKDRTGVSIAIILMALGVPENTIIEDYTLSNMFAQSIIEDVQKKIKKVRWLGFKPEHFYPMIGTPAFIIKSTLDHLYAQYGNVENYLTQAAGLQPVHITNLRNNLLITKK